MKKGLIFILFVLCLSRSFGQINSEFVSLINGEIRSLQPLGTIFYSNKIPLGIVNLNSDLRWNTDLKERVQSCKAKGINISKRDIRELRSKMKAAFLEFIPDSLFPNSKSLIIDSLHKRVSLNNRFILDSVLALSRKERPNPGLLNWEFYFSVPVYNKKETLMLFFFMYYWSSSGEWTYYITTPGNLDRTKMCRFEGGAW
jgi:hypothetical protein